MDYFVLENSTAVVQESQQCISVFDNACKTSGIHKLFNFNIYTNQLYYLYLYYSVLISFINYL